MILSTVIISDYVMLIVGQYPKSLGVFLLLPHQKRLTELGHLPLAVTLKRIALLGAYPAQFRQGLGGKRVKGAPNFIVALVTIYWCSLAGQAE